MVSNKEQLITDTEGNKLGVILPITKYYALLDQLKLLDEFKDYLNRHIPTNEAITKMSIEEQLALGEYILKIINSQRDKSLSKAEVIEDIKEGIKEVRLHNQGEIILQNADGFLNEL